MCKIFLLFALLFSPLSPLKTTISFRTKFLENFYYFKEKISDNLIFKSNKIKKIDFIDNKDPIILKIKGFKDTNLTKG